MAHPQTSPRGYIAKKRIDVGAAQLTANSTGLILSGSIFPSAGAGAAITADSTAIKVTALKVGAWSTAITVDSTGVLLGSLYISCNSTGNTTT